MAAAGTSSAPRAASPTRVSAGELAAGRDRRGGARRRTRARRTRRTRTSSSAPAASSASATSCSGTWPTRELYFCDCLWPDFDDAETRARVPPLRGAPAPLRPDRRPGGRWLAACASASSRRCCSRLSSSASCSGCRRRPRSWRWPWSCWPAPGSGPDLPGSSTPLQRLGYTVGIGIAACGGMAVHGRPRRPRRVPACRPRCGGSLASLWIVLAPKRGGRLAAGLAGFAVLVPAAIGLGRLALVEPRGQLLLLFLIVLIAAADVGRLLRRARASAGTSSRRA